MKQLFALTAMSAVAVAQMSPLGAQAAAVGIVTGTVNGTNGALAAVTVQALDAGGAIVGSAGTTPTRGFRITRPAAGPFPIPGAGEAGPVIGAPTAPPAQGAAP